MRRRRTKACAKTADKKHCDTFHADDETYFEKVWYWTTPIAQCLDGRDRRQVQGLRPGPRPGQESRASRCRPPRRRRSGRPAAVPHGGGCPASCTGTRGCAWPPCSSAPLAWLVVAYLGSLAVLLVSAFWTVDSSPARWSATFTWTTSEAVADEPVYRHVALRRIGGRRGGDRIYVLIALPMAFYMAKVASPRCAAAARDRAPHPAVGELSGEGVRLAGHARRRGVIDWLLGRVGQRPGLRAGRDLSCSPTCGCRT